MKKTSTHQKSVSIKVPEREVTFCLQNEGEASEGSDLRCDSTVSSSCMSPIEMDLTICDDEQRTSDVSAFGFFLTARRKKRQPTKCGKRCFLKKRTDPDWTQTFILEHTIRRMYSPMRPCVRKVPARTYIPKILIHNRRVSMQASKELGNLVVSDPKEFSHLTREPELIKYIANYSVVRSTTMQQKIRERSEFCHTYDLLKDSFRLTKEKLSLNKKMRSNENITVHVRDVIRNKLCKSAPSNLQNIINRYTKTKKEADKRFANVKALMADPNFAAKKSEKYC